MVLLRKVWQKGCLFQLSLVYIYSTCILYVSQRQEVYISEVGWRGGGDMKRVRHKYKERNCKDGWFSIVSVSAATASWKQRSGGWRAAGAAGPAGAASAARLTARIQGSAGRPAFFPRRGANEMIFLTMSEFLFFIFFDIHTCILYIHIVRDLKG